MEDEWKIYGDKVMASVLPRLLRATANRERAICSPSGYAFPPFMILERGMTLLDWLQTRRSFFDVCGMLDSLAKLLSRLHGGGLVHRRGPLPSDAVSR